jgi:ribonucleoside-triphosphate reductase|tara:strand:- start:228 stop:2132 length:1905 start_codon:yes stop_codon:yes gene_type:complete
MNTYFPTDYQAFIHTSRYAKWLNKENRRENWGETVDRYVTNLVFPKIKDDETVMAIREAITNLDVMPSMRAMMSSGEAFDRDNVAGYNCSYLPVDDVRSFDEAMFILLCGTGVGFSVERQYVNELPIVPMNLINLDETIIVADSKEGWAYSLRTLITSLYSGVIPLWDVSLVRPAGAKLKTFGGRASGPAPLVDLFNFVVAKFKEAQGEKLTSLQAHDIMCKIGEVVVVGGVRRSAMISLSNLSDDRMRHAKSGAYWESNGQRNLANNSVAYTSKPDSTSFMREWLSLVESGTGERGIFNRQAAKAQAAKNGRRDASYEFGTNPCSEIILRPYQFCNLSEVVIRSTDTEEDLERKVAIATILGTLQSTYTKFPYLRKVWEENTNEERLLGVSLTGIMDNPLTTTANPDLQGLLERLRAVSVEVNAQWAAKLGVAVSTAITAVKPSGTVSQLVNSASGIHARHSEYYIRTVRGAYNDPLTEFMKDQGIPWEPCAHQPDTTVVFSFPQKSPAQAVLTENTTAIEQLDTWLAYQRHWCEHKPSVTINVLADEWIAVGAYVYENFDEMSGVSFLPYSEHIYQQAPYQQCEQAKYEEFLALMPKAIDWAKLADYEAEDTTVGSQTFACSGGSCEIVDLV